MARLPDDHYEEERRALDKPKSTWRGSRSSAFFTIIKCNWGIGMMSMPYMLDQAGTISGVIMFVVSMLLTQVAIINLLAVKAKLSTIPAAILSKPSFDPKVLIPQKKESKDAQALLQGGSINHHDSDAKVNCNRPDLDYSTIMAKTLGGVGDWSALFSIVASTYGSCVAYMLFIVDNMTKFFPHALESVGLTSLDEQRIGWIVIQCVILCALAWLDSVDKLAPASLFGLTCAFSFAVLTLYNTADILSPQNFTETFDAQPVFKPSSFILAISIAAFCNEGIVVLSPSTHSTMDRPDLYVWTAWWGICFFLVCYMSVGIAGNILYSGNVQGELSLNFDDVHNPIYQAAVVLYSLQLIPTFAVVFFVSSEAIESKWLRSNRIYNRLSHFKSLSKKMIYFGWRVFFIIISGIIALQIPKFGDYIGLIGALGTSLGIYILPQVAYLRIIPQKPGMGESMYRVLCYVLSLFGAFLIVAGTYVSAEGLFAKAPNSNTTLV